MSDCESDERDLDVEQCDSEPSEDQESEKSEQEVKTNFKNNKNTKNDFSSKYSRDTHNFFSDLKKGEFLIKKDSPKNSSEILKINNIRDKDELNKFKIHTKSNKDEKIEITKDNISEFSLFKKIKIVLINYLNKIFEMYIPFNINYDFTQVKSDFCQSYNLDEELIAIIFKEKKISNKELSKFKLNKDFDFEKDFFIFIQAKPAMDFFKFTEVTYPDNFRNKNNSTQKRRTIMIFNQNIKATSLFLLSGRKNDNDCVAKKLEIYELNQVPSKYLKPKLSSKNSDFCDKYNFDSLLNKKIEDEKFDFRLIYSANGFICPYNEKRDNMEKFLLTPLDNYYKYKLPEEIIFYSDKIYVVNIEATGSFFNVVKVKNSTKTILSDQADVMSIFTDKKNKMSFISGIEFRPLSVFEI
jgi:hypothetical protein